MINILKINLDNTTKRLSLWHTKRLGKLKNLKNE